MPLSKPDTDTLMVDWLYGELDSDEAARFEERLASDPKAMAEAQSLKQTRAAFKELEDEEPSSALSAILMHEAAIAAPKAAASETRGGFWAAITGFFAPIAMHPAASAMATLIVVAGVAGTLYLRKGDIVAEPTVSSTVARASITAETEVPGASPILEQEAPVEDPASQYGATIGGEIAKDGFAVDLLDEGEGDLLRGPTDERLERSNEASVKPRPAKSSRRKARVARPESLRVDSPSVPKTFERSQGSYANAVSGADSRDDALADKSRTVGNEELQAGLKKKSNTKQDYRAYKDAPMGEAKTKKPLRWVEQQAEDLTIASKSKRCRDAGRIANDILDRDPKFYTKLANSSAVTDCKSFVVNETKRRAKSRARKTARKAKKRSGKGQNVQQKVKAAPQPNESAQGL